MKIFYKIKNYISIIICLVLVLTLFSSCSSDNNDKDTSKLSIVTTIFPTYDFARAVASDTADITMLINPGVESHSYEPTPSDIIKIQSADAFIYTGPDMENWAEEILSSINTQKVKIINLSEGIDLLKPMLDGEHAHDKDISSSDEQTHAHEYDPHIWTSPINAIKMVQEIETALNEIDPDNSSIYTKNADNYISQLNELDKKFKDIVANGADRNFFFSGRFALTYFAAQYSLKCDSAYDSCSTETEPSVASITRLINEIKENNIPVIYYEELIDPKVGRSIAEQTGAELMLFHTCHNISLDDFNAGKTYIDLMNNNAIALQAGLKK